jgi:hypothetical protein
MMRGLVAALALGGVLLTGCSGQDEEQAADLARQSCEYPAPSTPGFDPDTADLGLLVELDEVAAARADLAAQAAALDDRWQPLSDAATALAAYAARIREIRSDGGPVSEQMTPMMWDQLKYASDAYLIECRSAVPQERSSAGRK